MIALIDNYDSFVHNLARYLRLLGHDVVTLRNDRVTASDLEQLAPQAIVLSPGPCSPREAGCCVDVVQKLRGQLPMLGVCLGHQVIAAALGGRVVRATRPVHGRASWVQHDGQGEFRGVSMPFAAGRYHSLVVEAESLPAELQISAWTADRLITDVSTPEAQEIKEVQQASVPYRAESRRVESAAAGPAAMGGIPFRDRRAESSGEERSPLLCDARTVMAVRHREYPIVGWQFHPESILTPIGYDLLRNWLEQVGLASSGAPRTWRDEFRGEPAAESVRAE